MLFLNRQVKIDTACQMLQPINTDTYVYASIIRYKFSWCQTTRMPHQMLYQSK